MGQLDKVLFSIRPDGFPSRDLSLTRRRLRRLALHWDFLMRNRSRWIEDETLRMSIAQRSRDHLRAIGIDEDFLLALAGAGHVEVVQQYPSPVEPSDIRADQDGRRMPWESLLTMAARKYQIHERLVVTRSLGVSSPSPTLNPSSSEAAFFIESAPERLQYEYDFEPEYLAVETYLEGFTVDRVRHPTLESLRALMQGTSPSIVHLSAIDGHQGFQLLKKMTIRGSRPPAGAADEQVAARPQDGVYFRDERGQAVVIDPEAVAAALCAGNPKPRLVTFNLYNSSARLAAAAVKEGAVAAVGFQDFTDDTVAAIFFANLFAKWSHKQNENDYTGTPRPSLLEAFSHAVHELSSYSGKVRGSGIALWSCAPGLVTQFSLPGKINPGSNMDTGAPLDPVLRFTVEPYRALNYSVLHNGKRQIFDIFRIYKFSRGPVQDVRVEVNLNIGGDNFGFRGTFDMDHHILDLSERIAVGLTSSLTRSLRESVRTTVFVRVTLGPDKERFCKTFDVSLLAVDEWIDDELSGVFLPSFVLPRDPMVPQVISRAQRYLMALADDMTQGFDGYQSREDYPVDPALALEAQARAIWYTLQHDFALKYINPPPTFSEYSQRLRTPSDVLNGGRGTCIDLALVLAACFEYIGLHAAVFLLTGHAFVGYWTDETRRDEFLTTKDEPLLSSSDEQTPLPSEVEAPDVESVVPPVEWQFDERRRKQILEAVKRGDLVALEATYLTNGGGFTEAREVGAENLRNELDFDSMMDVTLAREKGVTPLPLAGEEGSR